MPKESKLRCSFCGKSRDSAKKLIEGPSVSICNECVSLCNEIVAADEEPPMPRDPALQAPVAGRLAQDHALRSQLAGLLDWGDAHARFDAVLEGIPGEHRGQRPEGLPYSAWELLEHLRRTQRDILEFCRSREYVEPKWPDDYWPETREPPSDEAWERSARWFRADRVALRLLAHEQPDLFDTIPHGHGQTYLRELLLVADHNAYHIGQLVLLRRLLGSWGERA